MKKEKAQRGNSPLRFLLSVSDRRSEYHPVEAGGLAAGRLGEVIATHVIPAPHADVEKLLPAEK